MNFTYSSIEKQKLLSDLSRNKLAHCVKVGSRKGFDLRRMVGNANLLDTLLNNIEQFNEYQNHMLIIRRTLLCGLSPVTGSSNQKRSIY
ncbi:uncharacterized protein NDAI_0K01360 [Naumovozyma dairenensis CBS 421]|uniref:Uncharacterized protein n=1 Tax=Naumovozyma dairenensis (strain ATCC 10597 / BCRC 20456 / CBS 421 / NBRC 0211 / NRRL Y-12639) TaxID=1071378 RepID=G0WHR6_NAUDC|nr:hypothetical protein NDAI_0K01360 [Naumovozyma dairenensis CBS 421]CCD27327.1 hypothetical protein NDAI_0K01360 [Naumovozyma dairenensis CBS 421]